MSHWSRLQPGSNASGKSFRCIEATAGSLSGTSTAAIARACHLHRPLLRSNLFVVADELALRLHLPLHR